MQQGIRRVAAGRSQISESASYKPEKTKNQLERPLSNLDDPTFGRGRLAYVYTLCGNVQHACLRPVQCDGYDGTCRVLIFPPRWLVGFAARIGITLL